MDGFQPWNAQNSIHNSYSDPSDILGGNSGQWNGVGNAPISGNTIGNSMNAQYGLGSGGANLPAILSLATHEQLMQAGNAAYKCLGYRIDAQNLIIQELRSMNRMAQVIAPPVQPVATSSPPRPKLQRDVHVAPKLETVPSPPPCDAEDYPDTRFWTNSKWKKFSEAEKNSGREPKRLDFMEDEEGMRISSERSKQMSTTAFTLFTDLYNTRNDPTTWNRATSLAITYFSNRMRQDFPEFQLCNDDWKIRQYATKVFPDWSRNRAKGKMIRAVPSIKRPLESDENDIKPIIKPRPVKRPKTNPEVIILDDDPPKTTPTSKPSVSSVSVTALTTSASQKLKPTPYSNRTNVDIIRPSTTTGSKTSSPLNKEAASKNTHVNEGGNATSDDGNGDGGDDGDGDGGDDNDDDDGAESIYMPKVHAPVPMPSSRSTSQSLSPLPGPISLSPIPQPSPPKVSAAPSNVSRGSRRRQINPLANLSIPKPPIEVPSVEPENIPAAARPAPQPRPKKVPVRKLMEASATALTARNLFAVDYLKTNEVTAAEFKLIWENIDKDTLEKYEVLSRERKAGKQAAKTAGAS